jgi:hypothetical protein
MLTLLLIGMLQPQKVQVEAQQGRLVWKSIEASPFCKRKQVPTQFEFGEKRGSYPYVKFLFN